MERSQIGHVDVVDDQRGNGDHLAGPMTAKSMSTIMRMIPKVPRNVSATTGKTIPELISASVRIGTL